jgi:membrane protease YdiL (CAAX protease family)
MTLPSSAPPRWTFAVATVIWAIVVGFAMRLAIAVIVPAIGGTALLTWVVGSPLGLALGASFIQLGLLILALLRSTLMPALRSELIDSARHRNSHWFTSAVLVIGMAPLANMLGMLVAKQLGMGMDSIEFVGNLVRHASATEMLVLSLALSLLPALVEETIFRGLVLGSLDEWRPSLAVAASALAFGVFHLDVAQGVATLVLGLGFGFIVQTTGSVVGAMVAHGTYNLLVLLTQRYLPINSTPISAQVTELSIGMLITALAALRLQRLRNALPTRGLEEGV